MESGSIEKVSAYLRMFRLSPLFFISWFFEYSSLHTLGTHHVWTTFTS